VPICREGKPAQANEKQYIAIKLQCNMVQSNTLESNTGKNQLSNRTTHFMLV